MRKPKIQQRTERRISAALRLVLVAVLLAAQLSLVFLLSLLLKQRCDFLSRGGVSRAGNAPLVAETAPVRASNVRNKNRNVSPFHSPSTR